MALQGVRVIEVAGRVWEMAKEERRKDGEIGKEGRKEG
jgi:hypothetical protein